MNYLIVVIALQVALMLACLYATSRLDRAPRRRQRKPKITTITYHRMGYDGCSKADFIYYWASLYTSLSLGLPGDDPEISIVEDGHIHLDCGILHACVTTDKRLLGIGQCNVSWSEGIPDRCTTITGETIYMDSISASSIIDKFARKSNTATYLKEHAND